MVMVIDSFFTSRVFAPFCFFGFFATQPRGWLAKLTYTAFRSLLSLATAADTNFERCKQF